MNAFLHAYIHTYIHTTLFKLCKIFNLLKSDNYIIKRYIYIYIYIFTLELLFCKIAEWEPMIEIVGLFPIPDRNVIKRLLIYQFIYLLIYLFI